MIIDDEDLFREDLATLLREHGLECFTASDGTEGLQQAIRLRPDVVLCDIVMPTANGIEVLEELARQLPATGVLMITAHGSIDSVIEAFRKGASDYILKPLLLEDVLQKIHRFVECRDLQREVAALRRDLSRVLPASGIVSKSEAMQGILEMVQRVARTRATVLITGESGTGKEVVARAIHESGTPGQPFVAVNCAAIPENLLESELFGHKAGAFTGARRSKPGLFEEANGGTLFLDEVVDLPLPLQGKLLRAIEQKEIMRVGGTSARVVDVRIITATHRDLQDRVRTGALREDLLYRLRVVGISLPPLRERREDISLLVDHFIDKYRREMKRKCLGVDAGAMAHLMAYSWPGNVRELGNVVERAMILLQSDTIGVEDLPLDLVGESEILTDTDDLRAAMGAYEGEHIRRVLRAARGNREEAARRLRIDPSTLYRKMKEHDLEEE